MIADNSLYSLYLHFNNEFNIEHFIKYKFT